MSGLLIEGAHLQNPLNCEIDPAVAEKIAKADKGTSADDSACPKLKSVNRKRFSEMQNRLLVEATCTSTSSGASLSSKRSIRCSILLAA